MIHKNLEYHQLKVGDKLVIKNKQRTVKAFDQRSSGVVVVFEDGGSNSASFIEGYLAAGGSVDRVAEPIVLEGPYNMITKIAWMSEVDTAGHLDSIIHHAVKKWGLDTSIVNLKITISPKE